MPSELDINPRATMISTSNEMSVVRVFRPLRIRKSASRLHRERLRVLPTLQLCTTGSQSPRLGEPRSDETHIAIYDNVNLL